MSKLRSDDRTTREDGRKTRAAIVAATLRVLRDEGNGWLTHRAVAREAGVSLALTTYHFATKQNLIAEALNVAAAETLDGLRDTALRDGDGPLDPASVADRLSDMTVQR